MLFLAACGGGLNFREAVSGSVYRNPVFRSDFRNFFSSGKVHRIRVSFTEKGWLKILADFKKNPRGEIFREARFSLEKSSADSVAVKDYLIGIRISGNGYSRRPPYAGDWKRRKGRFLKPHWKISFVKRFRGEKKSRPELFGVRGLKLKNRNCDSSFRDEMFCFDTFNKAGVPSPRATWAQLTVSVRSGTTVTNVNYGLYKVFEPIDRSFVAKRFPAVREKYGNLYKCLWQHFGPADLTEYSIKLKKAIGLENPSKKYHPAYDLKNNKAKPDHSTLVAFIKGLNSKKGADFESWIVQNFAVDTFLRTLAVSVLAGMSDDYWGNGNNYYFYHDFARGRWVFIPYDYDNTMGRLSIKHGNCDPAPVSYRNIDRFGPTARHRVTGRFTARPLVSKLLAIPRFRRRYHDYLLHFIRNDFRYSAALQKYRKWKKIISPFFKCDLNRGGVLDPIEKDYFQRRVFTAARQLGEDVLSFEIGKYRKNPAQKVFKTDYSTYPDVRLIEPDRSKYYRYALYFGKKFKTFPGKIISIVEKGSLKMTCRLKENGLKALVFYGYRNRRGKAYRIIKSPASGEYSYTFDLSKRPYGINYMGVDVLNRRNKRIAKGFLVMRSHTKYRSPEITSNGVVFRYGNRKLKPDTEVFLKGSFNQWQPVNKMRYNPRTRLWEIKLKLKRGKYNYKFNYGSRYWTQDPANPRLRSSGNFNSVVVVPGKAR